MTRQGRTSGLVLGELVLSIFIAGVVAMTVASQLRGSITVSAQAQALYSTTQKMAANWSLFAATCGAHSDITSTSPLLASPSTTVADVLTKGDTVVNPSFVNCYRQSHLQLLTDVIRYTGNTPQVLHYNLTFSGGGTVPFVAQFTAVPSEVTYALPRAMAASRQAASSQANTPALFAIGRIHRTARTLMSCRSALAPLPPWPAHQYCRVVHPEPGPRRPPAALPRRPQLAARPRRLPR